MGSARVLQLLKRYESRNVTFIEEDGSWPIVWRQARGCHVRDEEGRRYLDLTAAFGVAAAGHANPAVVKAGQRQMGRLLHAMGDVHPHALKAGLARELSRLTFERWGVGEGRTLFCSSGFEAIEAALKTALLATGRPGILSFQGAYHGLGYGALNATHRPHFRSPFRRQLRSFARFLPYPVAGDPRGLETLQTSLERAAARSPVGAVLVEPVQARGGIRVPPAGFLQIVRDWCHRHGALLVTDEIYTGFGRTGAWFASEHEKVAPDLICLGKALAGGFPISACVGESRVMKAAWPRSSGEALHTSTFLGHPVGCAMALAQIGEIRRLGLVDRSRDLGEKLLGWLRALGPSTGRLALEARGAGLMAGIELRTRRGKPATAASLRAVKQMLCRGYILLPEGEASNVIGFTPPLTVGDRALRNSVTALGESLL
ncbi:MAG TPA: aspartate aminotransferase family protein [Verrucomicrobiales bacterium]|nr:aspartate aminotransferase family protein [Verrucomicrobiales bacterium]